jgi:hypothetical protein
MGPLPLSREEWLGDEDSNLGRQIRSRIPEDRVIGRLLKRCAPGVVKRRLSKREDGQPYAYALPPLAHCRTECGTFIGHQTAWVD